MQTYRSVAARMHKASGVTQGKLDHRLERLGEQISERLSELTDMERLALDCWQHGIMPNTYEADHHALTTQPYVSIRKVEEVIEDIGHENAGSEETTDNGYNDTGRLKSFISKLNEGR